VVLAPGDPEEIVVESHSYVVLTDNFVGGEKGKRVSLPASPSTAALVQAGHIKPASKAATAAVEEVTE
jgi:hypothetical protein